MKEDPDMSAPVVVVERESGEVYLFHHVAHAEAYLEPIDVENGEYDAFSSDGGVMELRVVAHSGREQVKLERDLGALGAPDLVRLKLKRYFAALNAWHPEHEVEELPALVRHFVDRYARSGY